MRRRISLALRCGAGLLLLGAGACACGGRMSDQKPQARSGSKPSGPAPTEPMWTVRIGSQGGFTGGGSGQEIRSDGSVESWSQITPDDQVTRQAVGHAEASALAALQEAMTAPELRAAQSAETGNMTTFLEWQAGGEVRRWSWAESMRGAKIPDPVQRAYQAALAAVNSARR
jgi:hypothetical protein